ncbi:unnamed protein product [Didymodactylos carnosus]|uniref:Uncharacterized protein n=1 Tax=Didymodactylos carnosus TaxID=1234261 RepID=A0A815W1B4_9BILA|nr:unnamed protein product [Didymodactylos carnosus]CAF4397252.1 unnamed protein product [Didymodactylos carnosus]
MKWFLNVDRRTAGVLFGLILIQIILYIKYKISSDKLDNQGHLHLLSDKNYYSVLTPCVEPNCFIKCLAFYNSNNSILTVEQKQHMIIDLGQDKIINSFINDYPKPKICDDDIEFYPISFGFIEDHLYSTIRRIIPGYSSFNETCLPIKLIDFSSLIPGKRHTYVFDFGNELDYRRLYRSAYFAVTMKKAGWDCNRHYEIISSGTIPFFDSLENSDEFTMKHLPKKLLLEAREMKGINRKTLTIDHSQFNSSHYYLLLHRLLYYAKHRLTTTKLVEYMLNIINFKNFSLPILFISHNEADYQKDLMLHGFTLIFKQNLHVYEPPQFMYEYPDYKQWTKKETKNFYKIPLYGMGYSYALTLSKYQNLYKRDIEKLNESIVKKNIKYKEYSLVIFGSILRRNSLLSFVSQYYSRSEIILIDGEDEGRNKQRRKYAQLGTYFLREISNDCNKIT